MVVPIIDTATRTPVNTILTKYTSTQALPVAVSGTAFLAPLTRTYWLINAHNSIANSITNRGLVHVRSKSANPGGAIKAINSNVSNSNSGRSRNTISLMRSASASASIATSAAMASSPSSLPRTSTELPQSEQQHQSPRAPPPKLSIHPPLLNSASPWATSRSELRALLLCPSTGAITTRTTTLNGFNHRPQRHRYVFFDPGSSRPHPGSSAGAPEPVPRPPVYDSDPVASLNSLGYSPFRLGVYLAMLSQLSAELPNIRKTVIISVTGSPAEVAKCYSNILTYSRMLPYQLAMEINLSCPNIPNTPPPAYNAASLGRYLDALPEELMLPVGIKTPPYTYSGQFYSLIAALRGLGRKPTPSKLSFITTTNTLGSCLLLNPSNFDSDSDSGYDSNSSTSGGGHKNTSYAAEAEASPALPGDGIGGMAGPPLHPLALGNVASLRRLFDRDPNLTHLDIIGVGGVGDGDGYKRMRNVGAAAVGVATAFGQHGISVFGSIEKDICSSW